MVIVAGGSYDGIVTKETELLHLGSNEWQLGPPLKIGTFSSVTSFTLRNPVDNLDDSSKQSQTLNCGVQQVESNLSSSFAQNYLT